MKRKTDKNLEAIREYIENELSRNEITEERKNLKDYLQRMLKKKMK